MNECTMYNVQLPVAGGGPLMRFGVTESGSGYRGIRAPKAIWNGKQRLPLLIGAEPANVRAQKKEPGLMRLDIFITLFDEASKAESNPITLLCMLMK